MDIMLVDDEVGPRRILGRILETFGGAKVHEAASIVQARQVLASHPISVAFVDVRLDAEDATNRDGLALVDELRGRVTCILVTQIAEAEIIRQALRSGAHDFILKDSLDVRNRELFHQILRGLRDVSALEKEVQRLRARTDTETPWTLVGSSEEMRRLRKLVEKVAMSDNPALVVGPSGSGKEPVARAIHAWSARADEPFLAFNCSAIPEALFEAELFGYERGAFTGADRRRDGYCGAVGRGTLFLDEIGDLPATVQAKLLRVLEVGVYRPVGSLEERPFLGRVVAATHVDLVARTQQGRFREDLLFRLDVLPVRVPPLEARREDIPSLLSHFCSQQARRLQFSTEAIELLARRPWPGNVRQLRTLVQRLCVFADGDLVTPQTLQALPDFGSLDSEPVSTSLGAIAEVVLDLSLGEVDRLVAMEDALVQAALSRAGGVKTKAASLLGVHRKRIERRS
jgi:DNA-binding NtrC family response regulator